MRLRLSCEPWCWPPHWVAELLDSEVIAIVGKQAEIIKEVAKDSNDGSGTPANLSDGRTKRIMSDIERSKKGDIAGALADWKRSLKTEK